MNFLKLVQFPQSVTMTSSESKLGMLTQKLKKYEGDRDMQALLNLVVADLRVAIQMERMPDPAAHQAHARWLSGAQPHFDAQAKALAYFQPAPELE